MEEPAVGGRLHKRGPSARLEQKDAMSFGALDPERTAEDADALSAAQGSRSLVGRLATRPPLSQASMTELYEGRRTHCKRQPRPDVALLFARLDRPDILLALDLDRRDGAEAAEVVAQRLAENSVGRALRQTVAEDEQPSQGGYLSSYGGRRANGANLAMNRPCGS